MSTWTNDELAKIGKAEELEIASVRSDGTPRKPVTIWVVRVGDDLYVSSVNGRGAAARITVQGARYPERLERLTGR